MTGVKTGQSSQQSFKERAYSSFMSPCYSLKICSANILGNYISSSENNAGALSCLVREKVDSVHLAILL